MISKKKIVFITSTRADFGKIKNVINEINKFKKFKVFVFVTGMHRNINLDQHGRSNKAFKNIKIKNFNETQNRV